MKILMQSDFGKAFEHLITAVEVEFDSCSGDGVDGQEKNLSIVCTLEVQLGTQKIDNLVKGFVDQWNTPDSAVHTGIISRNLSPTDLTMLYVTSGGVQKATTGEGGHTTPANTNKQETLASKLAVIVASLVVLMCMFYLLYQLRGIPSRYLNPSKRVDFLAHKYQMVEDDTTESRQHKNKRDVFIDEFEQKLDDDLEVQQQPRGHHEVVNRRSRGEGGASTSSPSSVMMGQISDSSSKRTTNGGEADHEQN